jgi:hypothetical protein
MPRPLSRSRRPSWIAAILASVRVTVGCIRLTEQNRNSLTALPPMGLDRRDIMNVLLRVALVVGVLGAGPGAAKPPTARRNSCTPASKGLPRRRRGMKKLRAKPIAGRRDGGVGSRDVEEPARRRQSRYNPQDFSSCSARPEASEVRQGKPSHPEAVSAMVSAARLRWTARLQRLKRRVPWPTR